MMSSPAAVHGMGPRTDSCGTWTADRRDTTGLSALKAEEWQLGYLSGPSERGPKLDPLNGRDAQGVWAWIDNYSPGHPLYPEAAAAGALVTAHPN